MGKSIPLGQRFWDKVDRRGPDECWPWLASYGSAGYGQIGTRIEGRAIPIGAHRVAWMLTHGDPGEMFVLHHCDNRACVNPAHLFLGTQADNIADMEAKGRRRSARGERQPLAKLTIADVARIRAEASSGVTFAAIGRRYGICASPAAKVARREKWSHAA